MSRKKPAPKIRRRPASAAPSDREWVRNQTGRATGKEPDRQPADRPEMAAATAATPPAAGSQSREPPGLMGIWNRIPRQALRGTG